MYLSEKGIKLITSWAEEMADLLTAQFSKLHKQGFEIEDGERIDHTIASHEIVAELFAGQIVSMAINTAIRGKERLATARFLHSMVEKVNVKLKDYEAGDYSNFGIDRYNEKTKEYEKLDMSHVDKGTVGRG
mgnify:CR=1 FL=1